MSSKKTPAPIKCASCGSNLEIDETKKTVKCNYCNAKYSVEELLNNDSDEVKIQKIKSQTTKDIVSEKLKREDEQEQKKEEKENAEKFKKGKFGKFLIVCTIISGLVTLIELSGGICFAGIISLVQTGLYLTAWLMGAKVIEEKKKGLHILLAIIGFILIIPYFKFMGSPVNDYEKLVWDDIVLNEILPEPKLKKAEIHSNEEYGFWISLANASKSDYNKYVEMCEEFGFNKNINRIGDSFYAYDKKGNYVSLNYYEQNKEISVSLDKAMEMKKNAWPDTELTALLPKPASDIGKVETDDSDLFVYYAGETSSDDFEDYIAKVRKLGFNLDYSKKEESFTAKNKDGYSVSISVQGYNMMYIKLSAPSPEKEESKKEETTTEKEDKTENKKEESSNMVDGMRKEFKEAMDSYEEFMDEYISFMKKYNNSDGSDLELLKDYSTYMSKYTKMVDAFEKWEDEDLNSKEEAYYIKVQTRVNKKLLELAK